MPSLQSISVSVLVSLSLTVFNVSGQISTDTAVSVLIPDSTVSKQPKSDTLTIIGVGDVMPGSNFPNASYLPDRSSSLFDPVKDILRNADLTFGNLEGCILNEGGEIKQCKDTTKCFAFRMPEYFADEIKDAGFDMLSIANNHVGDFGYTGRTNTRRVLQEHGFCFAGQDERPWDTIRIRGLLFGLTAFSPNTGTLIISEYVRAAVIISHLDSICDIVVVSMHGGAEGSKYSHVPRTTETFYGENRGNVYAFARMAIDHGADVVFGHGPHVTRAFDLYKNKFIAYSMGNFCTYGRFNLMGINGIAPIVKIETDSKGNFISGMITSTCQPGNGGPQIDPLNRVLNEIRQLTRTDFPETPYVFENNGHFFIRKSNP